MDQEAFNAIIFMVFGLGFFMFVCFVIILLNTRDHREAAERRIMELREFGRKPRKTLEPSDPVPEK